MSGDHAAVSGVILSLIYPLTAISSEMSGVLTLVFQELRSPDEVGGNLAVNGYLGSRTGLSAHSHSFDNAGTRIQPHMYF